ncbi:YjaG family protein [Salinicola salarius]|uniref:YjaG family protein n=1 Tax=Salinicola salarius TaxID=430457 RepID=UPI0023E4612C|nr:YjaG family protein [Salinicola salarius]MDF3920051.1 YjaG family protein [Salinicola salarius]
MTKPTGSFNARLRRLDARQQIAFMAALSERLVPNYALYAGMSGHGNPSVMNNVLDLVWERLKVASARIDFDKQAEKLAEIEPPEDDDSFGARRATESVMALTTLLDALRGEAPEAALEVSRVSRNGVRAYIEMTEGSEDAERLDALFREHELMQDERDFQDAVLEALEADPRLEDLRALRILGRNQGVSNLGLSLD